MLLPEHRIVVIARDRHVGTNLADDLEAADFSTQGPLQGHDGLVAAIEHVKAGVAVVALLVDNDAAVVADACSELAALPGLEIIAVGDYARAEVVAGLLDAGATDVLDIACPSVELYARLRRSLVRATHEVSPMLSIGEFTINVAARTVQRGQDLVKLTRTEFDLFMALVRRPDRVVSSAELLRAGLGYDHADPHVLTVHIQRLRSKVEPEPSSPSYIKSVRGVGYLFARG